jgi:hypothetical protein
VTATDTVLRMIFLVEMLWIQRVRKRFNATQLWAKTTFATLKTIQ